MLGSLLKEVHRCPSTSINRSREKKTIVNYLSHEVYDVLLGGLVGDEVVQDGGDGAAELAIEVKLALGLADGHAGGDLGKGEAQGHEENGEGHGLHCSVSGCLPFECRLISMLAIVTPFYRDFDGRHFQRKA